MTIRRGDNTPPMAGLDTVICEACSATVPNYDTIHIGNLEHGYQQLCNQCFNAQMAERSGLKNFDNHRIESMLLVDSDGKNHQFHFTTHLFGDKVAIEAFEMEDGIRGGYKFQVLGEPDEERFALLGQLVQKMRRALAVKHLSHDQRCGWLIADQCVRGRIDADLESTFRMPMLVIDGQNVTWDEFGQMLMSFEGWQFRLDIVDRSQET